MSKPKYINTDRYCANLREMKTNDKNTVYEYYDDGIDLAISEAATFPAADVQEVRHGRWIHKDPSGTSCSKCGSLFPMFLGLYDYCPNCGSRMDLDEVEE